MSGVGGGTTCPPPSVLSNFSSFSFPLFLAAAPRPTAPATGAQPQDGGNFRPTPLHHPVSPSPPAPQPVLCSQTVVFFAIYSRMQLKCLFTATCGRMQLELVLRTLSDAVKECSSCRQLAFLYRWKNNRGGKSTEADTGSAKEQQKRT